MLDQRAIQVTTVLGDKLRFRRMSGEEALSRPFRFELELASDDGTVPFQDVLGTAMAVQVPLLGGGKRWFHGLVAGFAFQGYESDEARYVASLRPWLWFLSRTQDCRIFQNKSVPEIARLIFGKYGEAGAEVEDRLSGSYAPRVYCVQYRESDLDFVDRLLQAEGITYFFTHAADRHTLVLADAPEAHQPVPDYEELPYFPESDFARRERDHVFTWDTRAEVRSGSFVHTSFDFEKPRANLLTRHAQPLPHGLAEGEVYDYPGGYTQTDEGDRTARLRIEADQARHHSTTGMANATGLAAGHRFALTGFPRDDQNAAYVLREVEHELTDPAYRSGVMAGQEVEPYRCRFVALPADIPYRPPLTTPRPMIRGPQTAIVTGPAGEEIHTDKYGRVKIQFPWDREGKLDENSSCWVRVSQPWAGTGFGGIMIPRIGQEVIVEFLEGDPDQPIVTGRVYNAQAMPPYGLPANATQSGLKSNSSKGGGGSNELRFEDKKGEEQVYLHAQHDMQTVVEHDETHTVHGKRTQVIDLTDDVTVGKGRTTAVKAGGDKLTVTGDRTVSSTTKHHLEAPAVEVNGTSTVKIGSADIKVDGTTISINGATSLTLSVGGSSIKLDPSGVTILGPLVKIN
jgi:type VI secretion system secreted protein VgrG